jgi:hypothetical protein
MVTELAASSAAMNVRTCRLPPLCAALAAVRNGVSELEVARRPLAAGDAMSE